MNFLKTRICLVCGLTALTVVTSSNLSKIEKPVPKGAWVDISDKSYFVVFNNDGTYVESTFNLPRDYSVTGNTLKYFDISGELRTVTMSENYCGHLAMTVNGESHVLKKTEEAPKLSGWSEGLTGEPLGAYKLVNDFTGTNYMRLFDNDIYRAVFGELELQGKYTKDAAGNLYLLTQDNKVLSMWTPFEGGFVSGKMSGAVDFEEVAPTSQDGEPYITLNGVLSHAGSGVSYTFYSDGKVDVNLSGMFTGSLEYSASSNGLISIIDKTGAGVTDYLYLDTLNGFVYRYIISTDSWFNYLLK